MYEILHELMEKSFAVTSNTKEPAGFGFIFVMILIISGFTIIATQAFIQIKNIFELIVRWRKSINERKIELNRGVKLNSILSKLDEDVLEDLHKIKEALKVKNDAK